MSKFLRSGNAFLGWLLLIFWSALPLRASEYIPPMPADFSKVEVYLQTVGFGSDLAAAFGHSGIRVIDRGAGSDVLFNWGVFDFDDSGFIFKFVYGATDYRLAAYSMQNNLAQYRYERRTVVTERINLSDLQKQNLMAGIIHDSQPENLYFRYHYYFQNCSTKVRDLLNKVLGGAIERKYQSMAGTETLRQAIKDHFGFFPWTAMATEILMNGDLELQMTAWQEMFLPARMQGYLRTLPQYDDQGIEIAGTHLLTDEVTLLKYAPPAAFDLNGFQMTFLLAVPLLLIAGLLLMSQRRMSLGYRLLGGVAIAWGGFAGFFGFAMIVIWAFFVHVHGKHSANLWVFWPTDFIWMYYGWVWLRSGAGTARLGPIFKINAAAHIAALLLSLLLYGVGVIQQDIRQVLYYLAPITALLVVLSLKFGESARRVT